MLIPWWKVMNLKIQKTVEFKYVIPFKEDQKVYEILV